MPAPCPVRLSTYVRLMQKFASPSRPIADADTADEQSGTSDRLLARLSAASSASSVRQAKVGKGAQPTSSQPAQQVMSGECTATPPPARAQHLAAVQPWLLLQVGVGFQCQLEGLVTTFVLHTPTSTSTW